ncbi:MAG: T9SS type A sorting domain-containing protein [candidate division KSB1 bacterium]|nr:T9SS type A sorting domain-containing protein [candidate division KSB1 bacterium]MDZ7318936.1 T9SS type A sorting domain-containing protein [candidate division KSB1 bacterium]MDZ7341497.1 T9SS type A sorting domain-containing protein [candidate division KSB1 bacterium]
MRTTAILSVMLLSIMTVGLAIADVKVTLPDTSAFCGDTIRVPIRVSDVTGLEIYSYQCKIRFDSTVIRALGTDSAGTLTQSWGKTWVNLNFANEVMLGNYGINALEKAGVLVYLHLRIVGRVDKMTALQFVEFEFNSGNPIAATKNGSIKVIHPPVAVQFKSNVEMAMQITIDGRTKKTPFDTSWSYGSSHTIGTISPQNKTPQNRFAFKSWSDGGAMTHSVLVKSDTTFVLNMTEEFLLTIQSPHGAAKGGGWYGKGAVATFSVDSLVQQGDSIRFVFKRWQGMGASSYTGPQCQKTIIMNSPVTETAEWGQQYFLKLKSLYGKPQGQGWYDQGTTVTFEIDSVVTPVEGTRRVFDSWSGSGQGSYSGSMRKVAVTMLAPIQEQAIWRTEHYLWLKTVPAGIADFKKAGWYAQGDTAITDTARNLIATEDYIYKFKSWSLGGVAISNNPLRVVMDTSHVAKAVYKIDSVAVTINSNITDALSVYVDGARHLTPYTRFWLYHSEHTIGIDSLQFSADSTIRLLFQSWSDLGPRIHKVKADSSLSITAKLASQFRLSMKTYPVGLLDNLVSAYYDPGDTVRLPQVPERIIVAADTLQFKGWLVDRRYRADRGILLLMNQAHEAIALYREALSISGQVADRQGHTIPQCQLLLSGDFQDTLRLATGSDFVFRHLLPGNYRITPVKDGCQFIPVFRQFPSLQQSKSGQNFTAIDRVKPEITLIHPNGNEKLQAGQLDSVVWKASDNIGIDSILVELSADNGATWQLLLKLQPQNSPRIMWTVPQVASDQCQVRVLAMDYDGNQAEDVSDGVFSIVAATRVAEETAIRMPDKFEVFPNYPNPFNGVTAIRFQIPSASVVTVKILNAKGQEVTTVFNQSLEAGEHQIYWDGSDQQGIAVSSGVYFYQVEMDQAVITRKLLYIR